MKSIPIVALCLLAACAAKESPKEELYINFIQQIIKPGEVSQSLDSLSVLNADELAVNLTLFENIPGTDSSWYEAGLPFDDVTKADSTLITSYIRLSDMNRSPLRFKSSADFVSVLSKFGYDKVGEEKVDYPNGQSATRFSFRKRSGGK